MADFISHKEEVLDKVRKATEDALKLVGGEAERYAKETISDMGAVDTGFLRNSITYAISGQSAAAGAYQDDAGTQHGQYAGTAPDEGGSQLSVWIGTNVYYAPYVEMGTVKMKARPFLNTAVNAHSDEYKKLFDQAFDHYF